MLIIATATSPTGAVTHHLVRDNTGPGAYRRLRPLLPADSQIHTMSLEYWRETRGRSPRTCAPCDAPTRDERAAIKAAGPPRLRAGSPRSQEAPDPKLSLVRNQEGDYVGKCRSALTQGAASAGEWGTYERSGRG